MTKMRTNRKLYSTPESYREFEYDSSKIPTYEDLTMRYNLKGLRGEYRYEEFKRRFLHFYCGFVINHMMKATDFKSPLYHKEDIKTIIQIILDSFTKSREDMMNEYRDVLAKFNIMGLFRG